MSIIYVLIPLAILIVAIAIVVFFWAVKSDQFNDLDRQGYNILFDEDIKQDHASKEAPTSVNNHHSQAEKEEPSVHEGSVSEENSQQPSSSSNHAR
ncbi:cbb3-type cytochrome oxidase assembly protein CcoS [Paraneptunicella aestuarii]|uniref:cbb3-type cytochrome oxidase assembly protein CcoS n=1 Tax=Paraneptunicella aestuarii TaxID=2831148 RepID=UPI001E46F86B|nr:cbb3-type cytochrome oxidase assembly protein CcoS [Paraneptunicella aestuarii]UAA37111.1 cbb3-type cytochrome oxidase assembly protein CcoS [Paraneptunicella aestuarii]